MRRWRSLNQLRDDFKASGIDLGRPTTKGPGTHGCRGKVRHGTEADADAHLARLLRTETAARRRREGTLKTYRCKWCNFWHVGHDRFAEGHGHHDS